MKRIGLMGGTFNPVHNGHLILAEQAYQQAKLDEVWFLPAKLPPHKELSGSVSNRHRYRMLELAIRKREHFRLSDLEFLRKGTSYTYQTLLYLNSLPTHDRFYFIMGADSLFQFETWKNPSVILENAVLLVACRDDYDQSRILEQITFLKGKYAHSRIEWISYPRVALSSSQLRNDRRAHRDISGMVPESVNSYIKEHGLYESI